jgi:IS605 OrfB family transposase
LKDKHAVFLRTQARSVNQVWNFCNELSVKHLQRKHEFMSAYDMQPYTKGAGKELGLHSQTVQAVQEEYYTRRKQFKKGRLAWRKSGGTRRSLGWVPFKASALRYKAGQVHYMGQALSLWDSYGLSAYELSTGSFSEDSRGRWYFNVVAKAAAFVGPKQPVPTKAMGIDLGLKDFLATSEGVKVESFKFYRELEPALARAQRSNKKQRTRAIHARIANRRKDALHKLSTALVKEHGAIFVGNVDAAGLAKTRMAKSVLDAGWSTFRTMLQYKCEHAGVWFEEVNEAYSTQTCSTCDARSGPKGLQGLGIREWVCSECGAAHDRDVNAAQNILAAGHGRLAGGTLGCHGSGIPALPAQAAAVG